MLKDRDISQRTVGFISFSFLTHCGLIALAFLAPNMIKEVGSNSKSETYLVESPTATIGDAAQAEPQVVAPKVEAQPVEAQQVAAPAEDTTAVVAAKPLPQKQVAKKIPTPAKEKAEAATKKVLALPSKKAAPVKAAQKVQTVDQSELAINQALKDSRTEEESKPEVAADIAVPEEKAEAQEEQQEAPTVASATTAPSEEETKTEEAKEEAPAASTATKTQQPTIAPIVKGAQNVRPATQVGGLAPATVAAAAPAAGNGAGTAAGNGSAIRDADSLMEQPGNARPTYPEEDQRAGKQGTTVFDAMVTRDGSVTGIQLKQSSGSSSLDSAAYEAFKKHHYLPGQEGMVRKKFQFVLNGEKTIPGKLRRR